MRQLLKPAYHGGNLQKAAELYGIQPKDFLDFSANISWLGTPPGIEDAIERGIAVMQHYPDPRYQVLTEKIAHASNLPLNHILVGNGSIELIYALLRGLGPQKALVLEPTFSEYSRAVQLNGGEVTSIPLVVEDDWQPDLVKISEQLEDVDVVFLCNPNNPTGQLLERMQVVDFIQRAKEADCLVVVDEAFIDFLEDFADTKYGVLDLVRTQENLIVFRSFTKFFAIPGLRLGFCAASPDLISLMKANQEPWTVNCIAQSVGEFIVDDLLAPFREHVRMQIKQARVELREQLAASCNIRSWGEVNYLFLELPPKIDSSDLTKALGQQGVLVRDCAPFGIQFNGHIRIAVRSPEENGRLLEILAATLQEVKK